jgi:radical SAM superfamily enzyme YgiQ (UPF0313 family)
VEGDDVSASANKVLLLDLYKSRSRPYIQPYLYLGAFLDYLGVDYALYRWREDEEELLEHAGDDVGYVFINLIMGPVLGLVEPICRLLKQHYPAITIWVGGIATLYLEDLLERCPDIDHVSLGHPRRDPDGFIHELHEHGMIDRLPAQKGYFPPLVTNQHITSFMHQHLRGNERINAIYLSTSSGCHHRCAFCYLVRTKGWQQSIDGLFKDLERLQERHDVRYFEFADDNFPSNRPRLRAFCDRARRSDLDLSYFCLASIDTLDAETLDMMVASGLKRLYIGVDAIHDDRIGQLEKNYRGCTALETIELVQSYPLDLTLALVLGSHGETRQQIQQLYDWAKSVRPAFCTAAFLTPYPDTPTYYQAIELGFKPPDTLNEWAAIADFETPKSFLNPSIDIDEYHEWQQRFWELSTSQYRSGIGESVRRLE